MITPTVNPSPQKVAFSNVLNVWAVIEAILWPAFVVYHLLGHLAT